MKQRLLFLLIFILISPALFAQWQPVVPGIDYREFTLPDPNTVYVARMDRTTTSCIVESCFATGNLRSGTRERVSTMAAKYENTFGYWDNDWGKYRYDVVAAINGSGWSGSTGIMSGGLISGGWYNKWFIESGWYGFGGGGFAYKMGRSTYMVDICKHPGSKNYVGYPATGNTQQITEINRARGSDELIIYTPAYSDKTYTDNTGVEVLVELATPLLIKPSPNYVSGYVREIHINQGNTLLPFDHIVLSATGSAATTLQNNVSLGAEVRISLEIATYLDDWSTPAGIDLTKTYSMVGYMSPGVVLRNGVVPTFTDPNAYTRNPRTAVAYNDDYLYFLVVDGRRPGLYEGMGCDELGNFCLNYLAATYAINQDGGGSSTIWVDGEVKNNPSDGSERYVANGLMMISLQPKLQSSDLHTSETVQTTISTSLRLGPGTNYAVLVTLTAGQAGQIMEHALNGIYAKGTYWWKCRFGSSEGWVAEEALESTALAQNWQDYF